MEKIGIFGGSFNPPHLGHIQAAEYAMHTLGLDRLLLVPSGRTPQKRIAPAGATGQQRLEMLSMAAKPGMEVCSLEVDRGGESYTWETVREIKAQYPGAELTLLLGTDMFLKFPQWVDADKIASAVSLAALRRGDKGEQKVLADCAQALEQRGARVRLLENPVLPISSTQLRRLLAFEGGDSFLPEGLSGYIRREKLYYVGQNLKHLPMEKLEPIVMDLLNPNRVRHVLGCRDTAVALAKKWGADPVDAGRAGLLHDITKALDGTLQLTLCQAYGKILDDFSRKYPKTLHALTGSLVARRIFGENEAVASAIASHTTGKENMNLLETIIYVADYMEPNRDFPGVEELRALAFSDIRRALKLGLEMTVAHLKEQGCEMSPASKRALDFLNQKG